jgi:choline kinase
LLADPTSFGYEDVTDIPWIEIDFPEDIQRALGRFGEVGEV